MGRQPYIEGDACTSCNNNGRYWCDVIQPRGLCISKYSFHLFFFFFFFFFWILPSKDP